MNRAFWRGRRVFLTGHTGFKGSWLALWLQDMGATVTGYALAPPTDPSLFEAAGVGRGMRSIIADIRDAGALAAAMREARPEVVIHMAAQALVRQSYRAPVETYGVNVMGTVHVLEAVRQSPGVRSVVVVTSDKCYENSDSPRGHREGEPLGGYDPYSSSKACAELVAAAYRNSFFNPAGYAAHNVAVATGRAGNVIGGGDWGADRLIPDILRAIDAGRSVQIRNPEAIRPWQHVLEPLSGYLRLAERLFSEGPEYGEGWNFGPPVGEAQPVRWIVEHFARSWGQGATWQLETASGPHEAQFLALDCSKARERLDWRPRWDVATAIDSVVDWHRAFGHGGDARQLTLNQIRAWEAAQ